MKRLLFLILLLSFSVFAFAATDTLEGEALTSSATIEGVSTTDTVEGQVLTSGSDPNAGSFVHWYSAENTGSPYWTTSDCSDIDETPTLGANVGINTDAAVIGTNGVDCPGGAGTVYFAMNFSTIGIDDKGRIGFWVKIVTPTTWDYFFYITEVGGNNFLRLRTHATSDDIEFFFKDSSANAFNTATSDDSFTGTVFIEIAWDTSTANADYATVYINGVSKITNTGNAWDAMSVNNNVYFGNYSADATLDIGIDNIIITDDPTLDLYGGGTGYSNDTTYPTGACDAP